VENKTLTYISLFFISTLTILTLSSCALKSVQTEFEFANTVAKNDLWKEAIMRWEELIPKMNQSAELHNNLAIAYERIGEFIKAEQEYNKALKISPNNKFIKENYEQFSKKRSKKYEKK
jgi:Flp pilus assembly protein TadD